MSALAIDLFCGLGGWADGLIRAGFYVVGFDNERHEYGDHKYPAQLVIQDVRTLHGRQFKDATLIVASPPCQEYSYMAMPWSRAKQIARALRGEDDFPDGYAGSRDVDELKTLFDACFRIQREACEAAGRHIPMVVENVRGAQPWVGRARWNYGSYYLWGDVPALMPIIPSRSAMKHGIAHRTDSVTNFHGYKSHGLDWSDRSKHGQDFTRVAGNQAQFKHKDQDGYERNHPNAFGWKSPRTNSQSCKRKIASAMIAKIPFDLAYHIGSVYRHGATA